MALSFVTELNLWRRKRFRIRLDSILYLSWFTATINTTVCWSSWFSTDLDGHQYELDPVNTMSLVCVFELFALCSSIFSENEEFTFPFYSRTTYNGVVYLWYLVLFFSTSQWFGTIKQFCAINVRFLKIKTKTSKTASLAASPSKL